MNSNASLDSTVGKTKVERVRAVRPCKSINIQQHQHQLNVSAHELDSLSWLPERISELLYKMHACVLKRNLATTGLDLQIFSSFLRLEIIIINYI